MKRLFTMLIILFVLYLGIQVVFNFFSKGHDNEYQIDVQGTTFNIKEISNFKEDNYYFEISADNNTFKFQVYNDLKKLTKVIEKIEYFKDERYECILPIFKEDKILTDMMCINNNITYYYHDIRNKDKQLDEYVTTINNYNINKYI